ncbi:hypothetical protein GCM10010517_09500 [Streptosporangium fragile]|uniref:Uncharacterized protein n=1 Tax=Streptosporangium fragile TaxID=46186 RepID=A0ABN3VRE2_9ACTN
MSDEIHPLSRREGPEPPPEPGKVPLDTSLPDACRTREMCFALQVQSVGGMDWFIGGLLIQWVLAAALGGIGALFEGPLLFVIVMGLVLSLVLFGFVAYRIDGHRGWCWILRSLYFLESVERFAQVLRRFSRWILRPFRPVLRFLGWILRPFVWLFKLLSRLSQL